MTRALPRVGLEGAANSHTFALSSPNTPRIACLPNEILEIIFIHCARNYHYGHLGQPAWKVPSWVNVSYVCRHWRNVALSCPTLWTYVFFSSLRWTEELLARSKRSPLKIDVMLLCKSDGWGLTSLKKAMEHVARIQELSLCIREEWTKWILDKLSLSAPLLQDLELSIGEPSKGSFILFNGDTPSLRTLNLMYYRLPWYSLKLRWLTTLRLESIHIDPEEMEDLLAALSRMQDLSYLCLLFALPEVLPSGAAGSSNLQRIKLPRLSRLIISDFLSSITGLLSRVDFPPNTQVKLNCQSEGGASLHAFALLSSVLAEQFYVPADWALPTPTMRSLVIRNYENAVSHLTFGTLEHDHDALVPESETPEDDVTSWDRNIPLHIGLGRPHLANEDILCELCSAALLANVQSLHVTSPPSSLDFWTRILGHLPGLRYLKLSQGRMPKLASLLSLSPRTEDPAAAGDKVGDTSGILVPALEELELDEIDFAAKLPALKNALSTRTEPAVRLKIEVTSD